MGLLPWADPADGPRGNEGAAVPSKGGAAPPRFEGDAPRQDNGRQSIQASSPHFARGPGRAQGSDKTRAPKGSRLGRCPPEGGGKRGFNHRPGLQIPTHNPHRNRNGETKSGSEAVSASSRSQSERGGGPQSRPLATRELTPAPDLLNCRELPAPTQIPRQSRLTRGSSSALPLATRAPKGSRLGRCIRAYPTGLGRSVATTDRQKPDG